MSVRINIPGKVNAGAEVKAADHNKIIATLHALDTELKSVTLKSGATIGVKKGPGGTIPFIKKRGGNGRETEWRFTPTFSPAEQRLYIGPGSVFTAKTGDEEQKVKPHEPTLDGKALSESPYWEVSGKSAGTLYNIWCVVQNYYNSRMLLEKDEDTIEYNDGENAILIGTVTWKAGDDGLELENPEDLEHIWKSDLPWFFGAGDGSDDSGQSSDIPDSEIVESSDTPESSSTGSITEESGDDSSDSSDESDDSSGQIPCPVITEVVPVVFSINSVVGASCMDGESDPRAGYVEIHVNVDVDIGDLSPKCSRQLYVRATIGGTTATANLGSGGGYVQIVLNKYMFAETSYPITCKIFQVTGFSICELGECAEKITPFISPPPCNSA